MIKPKPGKLLKCSLLIALCCVVFSCEENHFENINPSHKDNLVSAEDAVNLLKSVSQTSAAARSRNGRGDFLKRKIIRVKTLKDEQETPLFHIINYEGGGFVIFSADNRVAPVLAYSETNNFFEDAESYPEGLVDWLAQTKEYIKAVRNSDQTLQSQISGICPVASMIYGVPCDGDGDGGGGDGGGGGSGGGTGCSTENEYEYVAPLLQTEWGQLCGYNSVIPYSCSNPGQCYKVPTGCVATAMAQVMRYHEYPSTHNASTYNWSAMPGGLFTQFDPGATEISELMWDIGQSVNMAYGCAASGVQYASTIVYSFINDFGYSSSSYHSYNSVSSVTPIANEIRNGRPVIFVGYSSSSGHAWVAEGYTYAFVWSENCEVGWTYNQFYMNWGVDGRYNGWYYPGNFTLHGTNITYNTNLGYIKIQP